MSTGARPWPVLGTAHQPRDHRIEHDVTRRRQRVRLVDHHRAEAALGQMAVKWNRVLMASNSTTTVTATVEAG
jgi:hypothetical protein